MPNVDLKEILQENGDLFDWAVYIHWDAKRKGDVTLDGDFTIADLRMIADYMEKHSNTTESDAA